MAHLEKMSGEIHTQTVFTTDLHHWSSPAPTLGKHQLTGDTLQKAQVFEEVQMEGSSLLALYASAATLTSSSNAIHLFYGIQKPQPSLSISRRLSHCKTVGDLSVLTGSMRLDVLAAVMMPDIYVLGVSHHHTELRDVLEGRKLRAYTLYHANTWETLLQRAGLFEKNSNVPETVT